MVFRRLSTVRSRRKLSVPAQGHQGHGQIATQCVESGKYFDVCCRIGSIIEETFADECFQEEADGEFDAELDESSIDEYSGAASATEVVEWTAVFDDTEEAKRLFENWKTNGVQKHEGWLFMFGPEWSNMYYCVLEKGQLQMYNDELCTLIVQEVPINNRTLAVRFFDALDSTSPIYRTYPLAFGIETDSPENTEEKMLVCFDAATAHDLTLWMQAILQGALMDMGENVGFAEASEDAPKHNTIHEDGALVVPRTNRVRTLPSKSPRNYSKYKKRRMTGASFKSFITSDTCETRTFDSDGMVANGTYHSDSSRSEGDAGESPCEKVATNKDQDQQLNRKTLIVVAPTIPPLESIVNSTQEEESELDDLPKCSDVTLGWSCHGLDSVLQGPPTSTVPNGTLTTPGKGKGDRFPINGKYTGDAPKSFSTTSLQSPRQNIQATATSTTGELGVNIPSPRSIEGIGGLPGIFLQQSMTAQTFRRSSKAESECTLPPLRESNSSMGSFVGSDSGVCGTPMSKIRGGLSSSSKTTRALLDRFEKLEYGTFDYVVVDSSGACVHAEPSVGRRVAVMTIGQTAIASCRGNLDAVSWVRLVDGGWCREFAGRSRVLSQVHYEEVQRKSTNPYMSLAASEEVPVNLLTSPCDRSPVHCNLRRVMQVKPSREATVRVPLGRGSQETWKTYVEIIIDVNGFATLRGWVENSVLEE